MSTAREGVLASYDYLDSTLDAIRELREKGFEEITAFAPFPEHHIEEALGYGTTPMAIFTLVGGLTGAATGFALAVFTSLDWPLVTGGKPILSMPAYVIIAFEMTILFGVLFTVFGVFWNMRVPDLKSDVVYDPEFSAGRFGIYVTAPGDRLAEARQILESSGPSRIEDDPEARAHG
ncbi:MAG: DUF3341 domain-containing protein [Gemmatimonadales bacterium]|nr:MAG: DUF3341 domain-containing protein [Gemmatimonadales bacterium]